MQKKSAEFLDHCYTLGFCILHHVAPKDVFQFARTLKAQCLELSTVVLSAGLRLKKSSVLYDLGSTSTNVT